MTHEDAIAHHAQQAAALRRERDEERASRLAILERLTPACEMLLAKGDTDTFNVLTGNGMHVPPVRRDVVEALREARAARDSLADELAAARARVTEYHREVERRDELIRGADADLAAARADAEVARVALFQMQEAAKALADELAIARNIIDTEPTRRDCGHGGWIPQADAQAACEAARTQARAAALEEAAKVVKTSSFCDGPKGTIEGQIARAIRALAASDGAWLEERLAEARREQAETDFAAWVEALADEGETSHPDVARAVAEHDAKVRTGRDNAWLSALETETVCAAPLTPRGMFDAVTSHDDRVHAAALEEAAEAGAFRVTDYDNVGVELEIIADRVRRAIQDIAATPSAAPAPERAKCKACGGTGNTGWPLRVTCAVCNGNGGTGEVK